MLTDPSREPEDEWEREAVLDPLWEKQQKKTFTAWCNSHLRKAKTHIENIEEDFQDGLRLMLLLEIISGEQLGKPDKGKMRFHRIANVNKALKFIESKGVKLVSIGAEEIVDGNLKMTLGMIWTIILRFAIQDISVEEMTAKEGLLLWCKRKTAPYKNVNVQNFHMSFKDGLAFCALIHRHRPDLIDYSKLSRDNPLANLNLAFEVAEKHLDIPRMLDADVMMESVKPDERSVMAYVSSYYHAFSGAQQAETAANRIAKVLKSNRENEALMEEYEKLATDLLTWIAETKPWLKDRTSSNTLTLAQGNVDKFRNYRAHDKPDRLNEKAKLETTFNTLQTKLRLSNRPAYLPTEGKLVNDIANAWKSLENAEKGYEEWILSEMQRLQRLDHLARKFRHKCELHDQWCKSKDGHFDDKNFFNSRLDEVKANKKKHEALENELNIHQERLDELSDIAQELENLGYYDIGSIKGQHKDVYTNWDSMKNRALTRKQKILIAEEQLEKIDQLHLDFAKQASLFNNWLDSTNDDLQDLFIVHSIPEIQALIDFQEVFKKSLDGANKGYQDIMNINDNIHLLAKQHNIPLLPNPYTTFTVEEISQKWQIVKKLVPERDSQLQAELVKQQQNEQLRKNFASKANHIGQWIEQHLDSVSNIFGCKGSLEDHLQKLKNIEKEIHIFEKNIDELEIHNKAMQEAMVFDNSYTAYTMETLRVGWEQLRTSVTKSINEVENQILTRDSKGISAQQMEDYRKSFLHFDKGKNRRLDPNEFRACLISIGCKKLDNKQGDGDFQRIMSQVDPNNMGYVTFEAFLSFMTKESSDVETAEQLLQAFKVLAGEKPYVTPQQLRHELPPEYSDYCLGRMLPYRGPDAPPDALDYTTFATSLYGESDL